MWMEECGVAESGDDFTKFSTIYQWFQTLIHPALMQRHFSNHQQWNHECGWKNVLNNLRLIVQPLLLFWLIYPWIDIFPNSQLLLGFNHLIAAMNQFKSCYVSG